MTETTSAPRVAQRDHTPASQTKAVAGATPRLPAVDNRLPPAHPDSTAHVAKLMEGFGTANPDFIRVLLLQLARAGLREGDIGEADLTFMISAVTGIKPRDQLELMLAAQMAAVHIATMTSAERLGRASNIQQQDSAERAFNKLARTFATQMEALTRHRTGGEQKVVQHVSVSEGGQAAIVGNVTQAPRESAVNGAASGT